MAQADGAMGCVGGHVAQAAQERLVLFLKKCNCSREENLPKMKTELARVPARPAAPGGGATERARQPRQDTGRRAAAGARRARAVSGEKLKTAMKIFKFSLNIFSCVGASPSAFKVQLQPSQRYMQVNINPYTVHVIVKGSQTRRPGRFNLRAWLHTGTRDDRRQSPHSHIIDRLSHHARLLVRGMLGRGLTLHDVRPRPHMATVTLSKAPSPPR